MFNTDRKIWGWGVNSYEFPKPMLQMAQAMMKMQFGVDMSAAQPIPTLENIQLPPSQLTIPDAFKTVLNTEPYHRAVHTYGKAFRDVVRALTGDFSPAPDAVAYPKNEQDIERILAWAAQEKIAVIPFGGGSSVVGGIEVDAHSRAHYRAVISLDLCHLNKVLEIDSESRAVRVQAGAYGPELEEQLKVQGYSLRHFPQSFEFSTLGGWIATRAGGHFATNYTHIDDFVESVRMITPSGVIQTRRLPGNGAGPQEEGLLLGSEGVLGVITEAWLRVQELPRYRASCTLFFSDFNQGVAACRALAQSALFPANARLIEREEAQFMGAGDGRNHILVLGFESAHFSQEEKLNQAIALCAAQGGTAKKIKIQNGEDEKETNNSSADLWKQAFIRAPYLRDELVRMGLISETFETCTTWQNFPALDAAVRAAIQQAFAQHTSGKGIITCRFTHLYPDGPAPYYTVIAPAAKGQQLAQWDAIKAAASQALIAQGATITHHHAVGKDHRPYYLQQNSALTLTMLKAAKKSIDPEGIMNPGTLL